MKTITPLYLKLTAAQQRKVNKYWTENFEFGAAMIALQPLASVGEIKVNFIARRKCAGLQRAYDKAVK